MFSCDGDGDDGGGYFWLKLITHLSLLFFPHPITDKIYDGEDLQSDYYNFVIGTVDEQLAKAGVRLGATLQRVLANVTAIAEPLRSNLN